MDTASNNGGLEAVESAESDPGPRRISLSEMTEYKDCRRKWYLHQKRRLSKKSKSGALALGTNFHEALSIYYRPGGTVEEAMTAFNLIYWDLRQNASEAELEGIEKDFEMGYIMLDGYFQWVEETGIDAHLEITESESEIEFPIDVHGTPVIIMGKRDLIGRNALTGTNFLLDHKTCQSFNDNLMDLNEQARMYLTLQRLTGSTVIQEVLWNKARKVKRSARAKPPFYQREELYIAEEELNRFFIRIRGVIRDILQTEERLAQGEDHFEVCYPRPSDDCTWKCPFRKVCPLMDQDPIAAERMIADMFVEEDPYLRYKAEEKGII